MKRGLGTALVLSASLALAGCNSPKPNPILNKTPAAETIMDCGVKEIKKPEKPESKLAAVPAKVSEEPQAQKADLAKKKKEAREEYLCGLKCIKHVDADRPDYDPTKDREPLYPVDENGVRLDKKNPK